MNIVLCADVHAHNYSAFSQPDSITGNSRLTKVILALNEVIEYASTSPSQVEEIVILGDLFHMRGVISAQVFRAVYETIAASPVNVTIIAGNHDQANKLGTLTSLTGLRKVANVIESPIEAGGILYLPFRESAEDTKLAIDNRKGAKYLLGHLGVMGASIGTEEYTPKEQLFIQDFPLEELDCVLLGHYHKQQFVQGNNKVMYLGSLLQKTFEDFDQKKGFWELDTDTGEKKFIATNQPEFIVIKVTSTRDLKMFNRVYKESNYYKLVSSIAIPKAVSKLPNVVISKFSASRETEQRIKGIESMSQEDILRAYVEKLGPNNIEDTVIYGIQKVNEVLNRGRD